jgi:hypothetical protein
MTQIDWRVQGDRDAEQLLRLIRTTCGTGDELGDYFVRTLAGRPTAWAKGFLRAVQRSVERGRA